MSQAQAAQLIEGLDQAAISRMERGERDCSVEEIYMFSRLYDVRLDWLFGLRMLRHLPASIYDASQKLKPPDREKFLELMLMVPGDD